MIRAFLAQVCYVCVVVILVIDLVRTHEENRRQ